MEFNTRIEPKFHDEDLDRYQHMSDSEDKANIKAIFMQAVFDNALEPP